MFIENGVSQKELYDLFKQNLYENPEKAFDYITEALNKAIYTGTTDDLAYSYHYLGLYYLIQNNQNKALENYLHALRYAKESKVEKVELLILTNLGNIYLNISDYDSSLRYSLAALDMAEKQQNDRIYSKNLNNVGLIYQLTEQHDKALEYYQKFLEISEKLNDIQSKALAYGNIGTVYLNINENEKALSFQHKCAQILEKIQNISGLANTYNNIGLIYNALEYHHESLVYYKKAEKYYKDSEDYAGLSTVYVNIAEILTIQKEYEEAEKYLFDSLEIVKDINYKEIEVNVYRVLSSLYENKNDYQKSLEYLKKYTELQEKLHEDNSRKTIAELQTKYETEKKEKENEIYRKLNKELSKTNQKLSDSEKELKSLNANKDKFLSIISHDLKSPFSSLMTTAEMLSYYYDNFKEEDRRRYIKNIYKSAEHVFHFLTDLLEWARAQANKIEFNPELVTVHELFFKNYELLTPAAKNKDITIEIDSDIDVKTACYCDKKMIDTAIRNLISNSIKFTNKGGKVYLYTEEKDDMQLIHISDNGIGMEKSIVENIFRIDHNTASAGTADEKGTGLGLLICKEFVEKNRGQIKAESELSKGSTFTIILHKNKKSFEDYDENTLR